MPTKSKGQRVNAKVMKLNAKIGDMSVAMHQLNQDLAMTYSIIDTLLREFKPADTDPRAWIAELVQKQKAELEKEESDVLVGKEKV